MTFKRPNILNSRLYLSHPSGFEFYVDELEGGGFAIRCKPIASEYFHTAYSTLSAALSVIDRIADKPFDYTSFRVNFTASQNPVCVYDLNTGSRHFIDGKFRIPVKEKTHAD